MLVESAEELAYGLPPVLAVEGLVGVYAELTRHGYVRWAVVEEERLLGAHIPLAEHRLEDTAVGLDHPHLAGGELLLAEGRERTAAGEEAIRLAEVHDVGIGIGEDEDAVVPELLLDEVELIGVHLTEEAEVSVSDLVVGECTTRQRAERCTELGLRHAPVLDLEEVTTLKVGIQHLLDVRYPKGREAAQGLLAIQSEEDAAEVQYDVSYHSVSMVWVAL